MAGTEGTRTRSFSRRGILTNAAAVTAAALAVKAVTSGEGAEAADGNNMRIGAAFVNTGQSTTYLNGNFNERLLSFRNDSAGNRANAISAWVATASGNLGDSIAIFGKNGAVSGKGVWGESVAFNGIGVKGLATAQSGVAVRATSTGLGGRGVIAEATGGGAIGLVATSTGGPGLSSTGTIGIVGNATQAGNDGVFGSATTGAGVHGFINAPGGVGVAGEAATNGGTGVTAEGTTGIRAAGAAALPTAVNGAGVQSQATLTGVFGDVPAGLVSQEGVGVWGASSVAATLSDATNLLTGTLGTGLKIGAAGVGGTADVSDVAGITNSTGVVGIGTGADSRGVHGKSDIGTGIGVFGVSADGIGVAAESTTGTGLRVRGVNQFSQVGTGTIPVGKRTHAISGLRVTPNSGVVASLNTAPGAGVSLVFTRVVPAANKVVLILSQKAKRATKFTYFIVDRVP